MKRTTAWEWDWISAGLLFLLLQTVAARLVTTEWTSYLYWTETLVGFGTVLGLALGISRFRRGAVAALVIGYTAVMLPWQITRSAPDDLLLDRLNRVGWILGTSFSQFVQRQPVKDPLLFLLFVCLAFWMIGVAAGYWLSRQGRALPAIAISGAAIIIIQSYGSYQPRGSWWLAIFVMMAVLLTSRLHFLHRQKQWVQGRVFVSEEAGTNILAGLFMTAAVAIFLAWWIPSAPGSVQRAADAWNTFVEPIRERLSNAVTSLQGPYGKPGRNFYGSSMSVGQEAVTGNTTVMVVEVLESPELNMRYYWRGRVYSTYDRGLWSGPTTAKLLLHPNEDPLAIPDSGGRSEGVFQITSLFPTQTLLYGPQSMVWVDRAVDVAAMRTAPDVYDIFSWQARAPVSSGSTYKSRSELLNPTVAQLRAAGNAYPSWVAESYLGIPQQYRAQLTRLAEEVAARAPTPYDQVAAITNYLRTTIKYSTSVPAPPEGKDPVMWVLFDYKSGFCNYYASAEVLLLRSIGIPARLAVGFAHGEYSGEVYTVARRDAHAWPEVYFPGLGWVEFEPTSNQDALVRPSGTVLGGVTPANPLRREPLRREDSRDLEGVEIAPPAAPLPFRLTPVGKVVYGVLPVLLAALAAAGIYRFRLLHRLPAIVSRTLEVAGGPAPRWVTNWQRWNELAPIERTFASVRWCLSLLGKSQPLQATPAAQAAALSRVLPSAGPYIDALQEELERGLFTEQPPDLGRAQRARLGLLLHAIRARLAQIMDRIGGRPVYSDDQS